MTEKNELEKVKDQEKRKRTRLSQENQPPKSDREKLNELLVRAREEKDPQREIEIEGEIDRLINQKVEEIKEKYPQILGQAERVVTSVEYLLRTNEERITRDPVNGSFILNQILGERLQGGVLEVARGLSPEEIQFLLEYAKRKLERTDVYGRIETVLGLNWGRMTEEQQSEYVGNLIQRIRSSFIEPSMLTTSPIWLELTRKMTDERTFMGVKDKFSAHFNLLKFYLGSRNLADTVIGVEDFAKGLDLLSSGNLADLFKEKEIQVAYDLLRRERKRTLEINTESSLWGLIESLVPEYIREIRKERSSVSEQEAKSALAEAFDLFYIFESLQDLERSKMKPDSVRKALHIAEWMKGKFAPELVNAFSKYRFYRKDDSGNFVPLGRGENERQRLQTGVDTPLFALFQELKVGAFFQLGFKVRRNELPIYNWRGGEVQGYGLDSSGKKTGEQRAGGTYVFYKEDSGDEVEVLVKKDGSVVVVRLSNISGKILGEIFSGKTEEGKSFIPQKWLGTNYAKNNLIYGEKTRLTFLKTQLLSDPIGSLDGELKDPLKRLAAAESTGDFYSNMGWRYSEVEGEEREKFELTKDDFVEEYLRAVLNVSKNRKSGKFKDNTNYIIGGDSFRSVIINEARRYGFITDEGEARLTKEFFGGWLGRYLKRTISAMPLVVAWRYPGMKGRLLQAAWGSFWEFFKAYVLEGTGAESIFGTKPKR